MTLEFLQNVPSMGHGRGKGKAKKPEKVEQIAGGADIPQNSKEHIYVIHPKNIVAFRLRQGKSVGKNGCEVDRLIEVALLQISLMNRENPNNNLTLALSYLSTALGALDNAREDFGGDLPYPSGGFPGGGGGNPGNGGGNPGNGGGNPGNGGGNPGNGNNKNK